MNGPFGYLSDIEQGKRQKSWVYVAGLVVSGLLAWVAFLIGDGRLAADSYSEVGKTTATVLGWCLGTAAAVFVFLCVVAFGGEYYRQRDKPIDDRFLTSRVERIGWSTEEDARM